MARQAGRTRPLFGGARDGQETGASGGQETGASGGAEVENAGGMACGGGDEVDDAGAMSYKGVRSYRGGGLTGGWGWVTI